MPQRSAVLPAPELFEDQVAQPGDWMVVVFDNDFNTFDEVIGILQKATGCSLEEAQMETWEVHHLGRSIVHYGEKPECDRAAAIITTIGIRVAVERL